jgi:hypothetical protein
MQVVVMTWLFREMEMLHVFDSAEEYYYSVMHTIRRAKVVRDYLCK